MMTSATGTTKNTSSTSVSGATCRYGAYEDFVTAGAVVIVSTKKHTAKHRGPGRRPPPRSNVDRKPHAALNSFHLAKRNSASSIRLFQTPTLEKRSS